MTWGQVILHPERFPCPLLENISSRDQQWAASHNDSRFLSQGEGRNWCSCWPAGIPSVYTGLPPKSLSIVTRCANSTSRSSLYFQQHSFLCSTFPKQVIYRVSCYAGNLPSSMTNRMLVMTKSKAVQSISPNFFTISWTNSRFKIRLTCQFGASNDEINFILLI